LRPEDAQLAARLLGVLIDGIWVRSGSLSEPVDSKLAIGEAEYAIMKLLPNDAESIAKHKAARARIETIAAIALGSKAFRDRSIQN
jgi:TetR/AcrR family transcriptional repressor of bet genes